MRSWQVAVVAWATFGALSCAGAAPRPGAATTPPVRTAPPRARAAVVSTGGMWLPEQLEAQIGKLTDSGLAIAPASLTRSTELLAAAVTFGQCSASFVSAEGLVLTNQHCVPLDLSRDGFVARTRAEEKSAPRGRLRVLHAIHDVTERMSAGLERIADDRARAAELDRRRLEIVGECERQPEIRCSVAELYEGEQYRLVEQVELRDVRLVWAPPPGVARFGDRIDNWKWPRQAADVALLRAYVGKDGRPAEHAAENVPYKPAHHFRIASSPLREGDPVLLAGYPVASSTLATRAELENALTSVYPRKLKLYGEYITRLDEATKDDADAQARARPLRTRYADHTRRIKGLLDGLAAARAVEERRSAEDALRAFIEADPERRSRWGSVLDEIAAEVAKVAGDDAKRWEIEELSLASLVSTAIAIVHAAEERARPGAPQPTQPGRPAPRYNRKIDEALLALALERIARRPAGERTPAFALLMGKTRDTSPDAIRTVVSSVYAATTLADDKAREALFSKATLDSLRASKDPLVQVALALAPVQKELEEHDERFRGKMALLKPRYVKALRAFRREPFASDGAGMLSIGFGSVQGFTSGTARHEPFSTLSQLVARSSGAAPYDVPPAVLDAARTKRPSPYVDEKLGDVPVGFLADFFIAGGLEGAAVLDARGELVGVMFDGVYEAMAAEWMFLPTITRSMHVDIRCMLWLLDGPLGAPHLLGELNVRAKR